MKRFVWILLHMTGAHWWRFTAWTSKSAYTETCRLCDLVRTCEGVPKYLQGVE